MPEKKDLKKDGPRVVTREMSFVPSSLNEDSRTIDVEFTTGAKVLRYSWYSDQEYYEELEVSESAIDFTRLNSGAPFLDGHSQSNDSVIGVVERAWIEDGKGIATVRFDTTDKANLRFDSIKNKILRHVSVGYSVQEFVRKEEEGSIPTFTAVRWEPLEISLVSIPADRDARVRANEPFDKKVEVEPTGVEVREDKTQINGEEIMPPVETKTEISADEIKKQERARAAKISKLGESLGLVEMARGLVESGEEFDAASDLLIAEKAKRDAEKRVSTITAGESSVEKNVRAVEDALLFKANRSRYSELAKDNKYARGTFTQIARHLTGSDAFSSDMEVIRRAVGTATGDLPNILGNVANKVLRDEYAYLGNNYEGIIRRGEARDFRDLERDRLSDASSLDMVGELEDYKMGGFGDSKEVYRVAKYGKLFPISFEALKNDDLNAFSRVASKIAIAAQRRERALVWDIFLNNPTMNDGEALFSAAHGNLDASGAALSDTSLEAGYIAFMAQKGDPVDGDGEYLAIPPQYLIVAPKLKVTAQKLLAQITPTQYSNVNPFSGELQLIVEPKLTALNSGLSWFLSASPNAIDTIELAYLSGEGGLMIDEIPEIKNDSIMWKARLVAGSAPIDFRGLYKNVGA